MRDGWDDAGRPPETGETDPTIIIEDEALRRGFTQLPNYVFEAKGLSHSAKLTYALILRYAWQKDCCWPGQDALAQDLEVSTRSVIEYLKELQAYGLIRIQRRGLGKTNVYHVLRYRPTPTGPETSSHLDVKDSSHQKMNASSHPESKRGSAQHMKPASATDVQPSSAKKDVPRTRRTERKDPKQQHAAAPPKSSSLSLTDAAIETMRRYGIRSDRLVTELADDPGEVFAQVSRLEDELARGTVTNPAGWLVDAIRGKYRLGGDESPASAAPVMDRPADGDDGSGSLADEVWLEICREVRAEITDDNYRRWFLPTTAVALHGEVLTIAVPDAFHQQWLDRRLRGIIERATSRAHSGAMRVEFMPVDAASA